MARRRRSYRPSGIRHYRSYRVHHKSKKIPLATVGGLIGTLFATTGAGRSVGSDLINGDFNNLAYDAKEQFACIDSNGKFYMDQAIRTYAPVIVGALISRFVGPLVNRKFNSIPFIGKYIGI